MRFTSQEKPLEIKPGIFLGVLTVSFKLAFLFAFGVFGLYYIPSLFGVDYSQLFEVLGTIISLDTLKSSVIYLAGLAYCIVVFANIIELSSTKLLFMNEGFEYHYGQIVGLKKEIFYSNVLRINYENGLFYGNILIELTGTDLRDIKIPYVRYPGATTAKIKKRIDDSVSNDLFERMKNADKSLEEKTAENLVMIVRSDRINKDNIATNLEHALDGDKVSKNVFEILLAQLLRTGKISKSDLSAVIFSMHERGLITKKDIADVLFYLNNI